RAYDPFGRQFDQQGSPVADRVSTSVSRRDFSGNAADRDIGLIDLNARLYDPMVGRFTSPDPVLASVNDQSFNPYSYVRNNPMTLTDRSGLEPGRDDTDPGHRSLDWTWSPASNTLQYRGGSTPATAEAPFYNSSPTVGRVTAVPTASDSQGNR